MKITTFIFETILEVMRDESFTEEFKKFAMDFYPIIHLCNIYEEATEKKINKKSIDTVISFIKDCVPLLNEIGKNIYIFDDDMLNKLILGFYIPARESYLKDVH